MKWTNEATGKTIEIFNEDCMPALEKMKENTIDCIITSPPYNLGKTHQTGNFKHNPYKDDYDEKEYQDNQIKLINELIRILKNDGSIFYNHKNRIVNKLHLTPYTWILKTNAMLKQELVWFNGSQNFEKSRFYPMTERIYWLSKTNNIKFKNRVNKHDLFRWTPVGTSEFHKRQFPIELPKTFLACMEKGGMCLDPYLGSGTTAIACWEMGFDFVGYELDKDYFEATCKRLDDHFRQQTLF